MFTRKRKLYNIARSKGFTRDYYKCTVAIIEDYLYIREDMALYRISRPLNIIIHGINLHLQTIVQHLESINLIYKKLGIDPILSDSLYAQAIAHISDNKAMHLSTRNNAAIQYINIKIKLLSHILPVEISTLILDYVHSFPNERSYKFVPV